MATHISVIVAAGITNHYDENGENMGILGWHYEAVRPGKIPLWHWAAAWKQEVEGCVEGHKPVSTPQQSSTHWLDGQDNPLQMWVSWGMSQIHCFTSLWLLILNINLLEFFTIV
jgi:hypothetical protein